MSRNQPKELKTPGRLDPTLVVLRKVDVAKLSTRAHPAASTTMELIGMGYVEQGLEEKDLTWFKDGLVLNDQPRTSILTDEIIGATLGFAIARTDTGEVIRQYGADGLAKAEAAVAGAKTVLQTELEIEVDEDDDGDEAETEE